MTNEPLTQAIEDYLKAIYDLTESHPRVTTRQLAERMGVAPASVTGMLQRLAASNPPLVEYQKHRGAVLTPAGRRAALEVIRHHRLLETYLQHVLGYSWDEVHAEADRLEHVISEELEERIARALGDPQIDPHGEPIPARDLTMVPTHRVRLEELHAGQEAIIRQIGDTSCEMLRYLGEIGLVPGTEVEVLNRHPLDGNLSVRVGTRQFTLGPRITGSIFVQLKPASPQPPPSSNR